MTVQAFIGGAGCGKTYELMRALTKHLEVSPLNEGQKVLALTFMHGSRRRLEERISNIPSLKGRADCSTVDSFAWRLIRRWHDLAAELGHTGIEPSQHDRLCNAAGDLVQVQQVQGWVAASFPVLLLDEAQDLTVNRLKLIQGLALRLQVFAAADEFQCLDEKLRPNPACAWLDEVCVPTKLTQPRRTNAAELLDAATAIRSGSPPKSGKLFMVQLTPKPQLAGSWMSGNLCWYGGGKDVAILTPTLGQFARIALAWSAQNKTKGGAGPYVIRVEESETSISTDFAARLGLQDMNDIPHVTALLNAAGDKRTARDLVEWMDEQRRAQSRTSFSREEIQKAVVRSFALRRRNAKANDRGWRAMTVHGAKNREFDNVILLWPAGFTASDDQKRRLLYNAVTRARARCLVLVQATGHLKAAPFA